MAKEHKFVKKASPTNDSYNNEESKQNDSIICGKNPVLEALKSSRSINKVLIAAGQDGAFISKVQQLCKERKIPCQLTERNRMDNLSSDHRGVMAYVAPYDYVDVDYILAAAKARDEAPLIIILAEVEDPHNLGAVMRTAECGGAHGVIIPRHGSVPLTDTVARVAAGAAEYIPVARVGNLTKTIEELKAKGLWIAGADMEGSENMWQANLTGPLALVMGSEGKGIPRLVGEACDFMVHIPMVGHITSLNVSVSTAILLYEALRQRSQK